MNASELWSEGAQPVDLIAARLLWKSPWWAHTLESKIEIRISEADFVTILCRLTRDFTKFHGRKLTMEEFADLASMVRKVRWKNPGHFGFKMTGKTKKKLALLTWNPDVTRFEFKPDGSRLRLPAPAVGWSNLTGRQRRRFGARVRKWKKEHQEERTQQTEEDKVRISRNISLAIGAID